MALVQLYKPVTGLTRTSCALHERTDEHLQARCLNTRRSLSAVRAFVVANYLSRLTLRNVIRSPVGDLNRASRTPSASPSGFRPPPHSVPVSAILWDNRTGPDNGIGQCQCQKVWRIGN